MRAKKDRGAKVPQVENQKGSSLHNVDTSNLSAIERDSFLEALQLNYGNPLHSTALEEDLKASEEGQINKDGRKDVPQKLRTTGKQHGAAAKRKETERDEENVKEEGKKKRSRMSTQGKVKAGPDMEGEAKKKTGASQGEKGELDVGRKESDPNAVLQKNNQPTTTANRLKHVVGKKPGKRRSTQQRPVKNQLIKKGIKRESESKRTESSAPQSQDESDTDTPQQTHKKVLSSDEEVVGEDESWNPSPKKAKVYSLGRTRKSSSDRSHSRKSSSGSASAEAEKANTNKRRRKGHGRQGGTELEVVLDAFLDFCDQYRESVESKAVRQSIDSFSFNVKEQLLEKISCYKELRVLKRENAKVSSLIRTKTQRLLDAKYELMRAERQAALLQKEKAELKLRLSDLRRGQAFLHDIRELNRRYLDYRHKRPREKETYGESSLAALLSETKLQNINNQQEKD